MFHKFKWSYGHHCASVKCRSAIMVADNCPDIGCAAVPGRGIYEISTPLVLPTDTFGVPEFQKKICKLREAVSTGIVLHQINEVKSKFPNSHLRLSSVD